jgi:hypothetical protein
MKQKLQTDMFCVKWSYCLNLCKERQERKEPLNALHTLYEEMFEDLIYMFGIDDDDNDNDDYDGEGGDDDDDRTAVTLWFRY